MDESVEISDVEKQSAVICKNPYFPAELNNNRCQLSEVMDSILVQNLVCHVTRLDLMEVFQELGDLVFVDIHVDATGFAIGSAIVKYVNPSDAADAVNELNNEHLDQQPMSMLLINDKIAAQFYKKLGMHY